MKSAESDLSTSYSFNIKSSSPVISSIVQMKMCSGTEIWTRWFCFNIKLFGWQTESEYTCPWLPKTGCVVVAKHHQTWDFLRHIFCDVTAAAAWGEFSWFLANCTPRCIYVQTTRIQWGQWLKYLLTLCGHSWTLPPVENFAHSVLLSHHICRHRYLDFDAVSLAPLRSTKFNLKHPKSCVKKILITVTIFLKKKTSPKPKITMYTHANCSFSEKKWNGM